MRLGLVASILVVACMGEQAVPRIEDAGIVVVHDAGLAEDSSVTPPDAGGKAPCPVVANAVAVDRSTLPTFRIENDPGAVEGTFDPSMILGKGEALGAMTYSAVQSDSDISIRSAITTDGGKTFRFVGTVSAPETVTIPSTDAMLCPGGTCRGSAMAEVSSLTLDPDEPDPSMRWKVYAHRYVALPTQPANLLYPYGYIAMYAAAAIEGPFREVRKVLGWPSSSSFSSASAVSLTTNLGLADCAFLTEPSAMVVPGTSTELSVGCVYATPTGPKVRIEHLRSLDHGQTFFHVGTWVRPEEVSCLLPGITQVNAADLHVANGKVYLSISPGAADGLYRGCAVFEVGDLGTAQLKRTSEGALVPVRTFTRTDSGFLGACAYSEGTGYLLSMLGVGRSFSMYRSGVTVP